MCRPVLLPLVLFFLGDLRSRFHWMRSVTVHKRDTKSVSHNSEFPQPTQQRNCDMEDRGKTCPAYITRHHRGSKQARTLAARHPKISCFERNVFFFFARPTLSVTGGSGVATAQSGPTSSQNPMGSDATARPLSTGFRDGARGFLADPIPKPLARSSGRRPGFPCRTHPKLPSGPQANLVACPFERNVRAHH